MRRAQRTTSGFTLLELVMVLAIIAMALMAVAPSLANFARGRNSINTAGEFVTLTHWARSQAVTDGATYRINIDKAANRWWVTMDDGTTFVNVDSAMGRSYAIPEDVKIETDAPTTDGIQIIEFDPSGRNDPVKVDFTNLHSGGVTEVICETPIDSFHIVDGSGS